METPQTNQSVTRSDEKLLQEYKKQLDDIHKQACSIAEEHLESSFDLSKSIGYKGWLQNKK